MLAGRLATNMTEEERWLHANVFSDLEPHQMRRLLRKARRGLLTRCQRLLRTGDSNSSLYLITTGACLVRNGRKTLGLLERGQFTGEVSFMSNAPASASVVARGEVRYLEWDREELEKLFKRRPSLRRYIYNLIGQQMARKLHSTTAQLAAA